MIKLQGQSESCWGHGLVGARAEAVTYSLTLGLQRCAAYGALFLVHTDVWSRDKLHPWPALIAIGTGVGSFGVLAAPTVFCTWFTQRVNFSHWGHRQLKKPPSLL